MRDVAVPEENDGLYAECCIVSLDSKYAALEKTDLQQGSEQIYMNASNAIIKPSKETLDNTYALGKAELQQETEQVYMNAGNIARKTASTAHKNQISNTASCKPLCCILTTITAMAIIMIVCIAYFCAEIINLKAQTASIQQSPFGQPAEVMEADILRQLKLID